MTVEQIEANTVGAWQIIPNCGAHEQISVSREVIWWLLGAGYIEHDPEYGPGARVFRPVEPLTDADTVRSWL
jgi:hypothetical protein